MPNPQLRVSIDKRRYLYERGRFNLSFPLARTVEKLCQAVDSNDSRLLLADAYSVQAAMLNEQTEMKAAITLWEKALEIRENLVAGKVLDEDHPNRAQSFMNLGVSVAHHDTVKAIQLHQKALEIRRRSTKFTNIQVQGLSLNHMNIGRSLLEVGELDKAAEAFEDCIAIIKPKEEETGLRFGLYVHSRALLDFSVTLLTYLQERPGLCGPRGISKYSEATSMKHSSCTPRVWNFTVPYSVLLTARLLLATTRLLGSSTNEETITGLCKRIPGPCKPPLLIWSAEFSELLQRTLDIYLEKDETDSKAQTARTKYKLGAVLEDANRKEEASRMKREAQILRQQLTGKSLEEHDKEEDYDEMIAYFYR